MSLNAKSTIESGKAILGIGFYKNQGRIDRRRE